MQEVTEEIYIASSFVIVLQNEEQFITKHKEYAMKLDFSEGMPYNMN